MFGVTGTLTLSQGPIALTNHTSRLHAASGDRRSRRNDQRRRRLRRVHRGERRERDTGRRTSSTPLTITDGDAADDGGGIDNSGTLTLNYVDLTGNTATFGGGLANEAGATLSATDSNFTGNTGTSSGGGLANMGTATLLHDRSPSNVAATGGGIWNSITGALSILGPNGTLGGDTTIPNNSATVGDGGGIDNSGSVTIG